jgi:hypothetical protein
MAEIVSADAELADPELKAVARRVLTEFRLAGEKAAAHLADPGRYPMPPAPTAAEHLFVDRLRSRPRAGYARAADSVRGPAGVRREWFGDLAAVDLTSATAVEEQAAAVAPAALRLSPGRLGTPYAAWPAPAGRPGRRLDVLRLRVHSVRCLDETSPEFLSDDDIYLTGTTVDENGDVATVAAFKVGDFDDGDVKSYDPPHRFYGFRLTEGRDAWPKTYTAVVVLYEKDFGDVGGFMDKLVRKVRARAASAVAAAAPDLPGGAAGEAGAAVSAWVVGKLADWVRDWLGDDHFAPATLAVRVRSLDDRFPNGRTDSQNQTTRFRGHGGEYELVYDWLLVDA